MGEAQQHYKFDELSASSALLLGQVTYDLKGDPPYSPKCRLV
jgi:hypothetical protein